MARWVVALRYEELPPEVIARAKRVLLDTFGCALGAIAAEPVRIAQEVVALQGGNPQATVLGLGRKVSCDQAAFLNGMALRYFDYNDYIALGRPNHASINVAAALAAAELQGASGRDLLLGLVAGYEVEVRLRDSISAKRVEGWDDTSIEGAIRLRGDGGKNPAARRAEARQCARHRGQQCRHPRGGAPRRRAHPRQGIGGADGGAQRRLRRAARPRRSRLSADHPGGPIRICEDGSRLFDETLLRRRSGDFQILKSCIKLWPCVGTAQAPIAAALEIQKRQPAALEIASITVGLSDFAYRQQAAYPDEISTREHADHSIPYLVARALIDGDVRVTDFEPARFKDPRALALKRKLSIRSDAALSDENIGANVEVMLQNGTMLEARVPIPPGNMLNPASDADLTRKFLALSESVLGKARAEKAIEVILAVDAMPDLKNLLDAVSPA